MALAWRRQVRSSTGSVEQRNHSLGVSELLVSNRAQGASARPRVSHGSAESSCTERVPRASRLRSSDEMPQNSLKRPYLFVSGGLEVRLSESRFPVAVAYECYGSAFRPTKSCCTPMFRLPARTPMDTGWGFGPPRRYTYSPLDSGSGNAS